MNTESTGPEFQNQELVLTRVYDAPRELVYEAWTEPERLAQWWGPEGFTNPRCEWDVRAGGEIHVDMRGPDGTVYRMGGRYEELQPPERIVFTTGALDEAGEFIFEIRNTVTLAEGDGRTILTLRTRVLRMREGAERYLKGQAMGWAQSLERFGGHVEKGERSEGAMGVGAGNQIVISRLFFAPREMVWEAMTDAKQVVEWWGPRGFTTRIEEMDVRPGGVWKHVMTGPDGTEYASRSVFKEVRRPSRNVYSHGGGRAGGPGVSFEATWMFDAIDENRTRLTIWQVYPDVEMRERIMREYGALEGGKQTLTRLAEELEKRQRD
jgi:uncharacterized protein YndB with AHSA1/START domain